MKPVKNIIKVIISFILIFLLTSCYNSKSDNAEVALLIKQKQEAEKLLIQANEEVNNLKDENFKLKLIKKELDQINTNENYYLYKKELSKYIEENINEIINDQQNQGATWVVTGIKFINPFEVHIYCEDGHDTMEANLVVFLEGNKIKIMEKNY
ncbi:MAG: hypothetical protein JW927_06440 [Deltaproteobacteria bacterium]|nr:hypothetical protein [Deltaproteobacteria bacterium]